ncbi:E3 ubiquitin-protein ligase RNF34 isoform X2 [Cephus cinctus]|uniref:E3 ubiquitin-protein ligase RNF34 isoform X2 n=1 Tax=Cephus cinctus TaxID=211228 RepID=A0AAJ7RQD5_CEPCN|nr:E3 ubiquitin-protein ligase RNF34 isoform X2 [Cephus cinctus]
MKCCVCYRFSKQCMECLRFFCTNCVVRRVDRLLSCDNCRTLSRRPLIRSQVLQMRSRDLVQYLDAKKISMRGCVEKEDLVNLLLQLANGTDGRSTNVPESSLFASRRQFSPDSPPRRSRSPQHVPERPETNGRVETEPEESPLEATRSTHDIQIEELSDEFITSNDGPEPLVTEQEDNSESSNEQHSEMFTELPTWSGLVKLSDINDVLELECLTIKQLKELLSTNRVDFKGCVEKRELLTRATRLWTDYKSKEDYQELDEEALCKICLDAPIECIMLECGHMACCVTCGKQMSECPICRQYVVRVVRFFKA